MPPTVRSVNEAKEWFMRHSSGKVLCKRDDDSERFVDCFPDAKAFFEA